MGSKKVLIIDTVHQAFEEIISPYGFQCIDGSALSKEEILKQISNYCGIVIRSRFRIDSGFLNAATSLKFVARSGAGLENIDADAAHDAGIALINAPEGNKDAVAEHAVAMLLSLFNRIVISDREVRSGIWHRSENRGAELMNKTVAIIGFGNMGSAFAQRLSGFSVNVIAFDKYITIDRNKFPNVMQVTMTEIFEQAHIVSLHVPLTDETLNMVNDNFINSFSKPFYIINTSRGKVLSTDALVKGIVTHRVSGACLDVFEYESTSFEKLSADLMPEAWKYLASSDKVILTPHIAGWTHESYKKLSEVMANKVLKLFKIN